MSESTPTDFEMRHAISRAGHHAQITLGFQDGAWQYSVLDLDNRRTTAGAAETKAAAVRSAIAWAESQHE